MNAQHQSVTLHNVRIPVSVLQRAEDFGGQRDHDCLSGDLVIREGRAVGLGPAKRSDLPLHVVLPKLCEPHVHLDKCFSISRMMGVGGDLRQAITAQMEDKQRWTKADIRARAQRGLDELIAAGCGSVRTHVDWGTAENPAVPPIAWTVLRELAQDMQDQIHLQVAPLIGVADLADLETAHRIGREIAAGGGVLGCFVLDQPDRREGIRNAVHVAEKFGLALDFHVDEGLDPQLDGLALIAQTVYQMRFEGPVLCGHACSLMNFSPTDLQRLAEDLRSAAISIVSLPSANLYLQGRGTGTPERRGITRIRELRQEGVRVVVGTDNVADAFCPLGRFDPRHSLALAVLGAHLDPPFGDYLPMITTQADQALGRAPLWVEGAALDDLICFEAATTADLLRGVCPPKPATTLIQEPAG